MHLSLKFYPIQRNKYQDLLQNLYFSSIPEMQVLYFLPHIIISHIQPVGLCRIFLNYPVKGRFSKSIYLRIYGSYGFLYYILLNVSVLIQDWFYSASKFCLILAKFEFFQGILIKVFNNNLHENPHTGSRLFHVDRRTDRPTDGHNEAAVTFYRFVNAQK